MKNTFTILTVHALLMWAVMSETINLNVKVHDAPKVVSLKGVVMPVDNPVEDAPVDLPQPLLQLDFAGAGDEVVSTGSNPMTFNVKAPVMGDTVDFGESASNSYVESQEQFTLLFDKPRFTLSMWVRPHSLSAGSGGNRLFSNSSVFPPTGIELVHEDDGHLILAFQQWPDNSTMHSSAKLKPGVWSFVSVLKQDAHVVLYVVDEGAEFVADETFVYDRVVSDQGGKLALGHFNESFRSGGANRMFKGQMKDVRIWGDALSEEQLKYVMDGKGKSGAPFTVKIRTDNWHADGILQARLKNPGRLWVLMESEDLDEWEAKFAGESLDDYVTVSVTATNRALFLRLE